jgi:hypothetical protein
MTFDEAWKRALDYIIKYEDTWGQHPLGVTVSYRNPAAPGQCVFVSEYGPIRWQGAGQDERREWLWPHNAALEPILARVSEETHMPLSLKDGNWEAEYPDY